MGLVGLGGPRVATLLWVGGWIFTPPACLPIRNRDDNCTFLF